MHSNQFTQRHRLRRALPQPVLLTLAETKRVSGGMVHKNDHVTNYNTSGPPGGNPHDPNPVGNDGRTPHAPSYS